MDVVYIILTGAAAVFLGMAVWHIVLTFIRSETKHAKKEREDFEKGREGSNDDWERSDQEWGPWLMKLGLIVIIGFLAYMAFGRR